MAISETMWQHYKRDIIHFINDLVWVPSRKGVIKVNLTGDWAYQAKILREATKKHAHGNKYNVIAICIPKQNGKTFIASLLLLWKFFTRFNQNGVVASNSKDQATSVVFDTFKDMIRYSPELIKLIGSENILDKEIRYPKFNSSVVVLSSSKAAAWGYGIDTGIVDEIHAAPDDEGIFQILASQTGPRDGQVILPSQVSSYLNVLYRLYQAHLNEEDPALYFHYLQRKNPSPLVTDRWLRSRKAQLTELQYSLYHENDWISSTKKLFTPEKIGTAVTNGQHYTIPVTRQQLIDWESNLGTKFVVGGGLDRALPYSKHGDRTFWTTTAKGMVRSEEFYTILNQVEVPFSDARIIKDSIMKDHKAYRLDNATLETYQASDIEQWAKEKGIPCELVHPMDAIQIISFNKLYEIVNTGQLAIPEGLPREAMSYAKKKRKGGNGGDTEDTKIPILVKEMKDFEHEVRAGVAKFGHKPGSKFRDDSVYSLNWSIYSLREQPVYEKRKRIPEWSAKHSANPYTGV